MVTKPNVIYWKYICQPIVEPLQCVILFDCFIALPASTLNTLCSAYPTIPEYSLQKSNVYVLLCSAYPAIKFWPNLH